MPKYTSHDLQEIRNYIRQWGDNAETADLISHLNTLPYEKKGEYQFNFGQNKNYSFGVQQGFDRIDSYFKFGRSKWWKDATKTSLKKSPHAPVQSPMSIPRGTRKRCPNGRRRSRTTGRCSRRHLIKK